MLREAAVVTPACHPIIHAWVERRSRDDRDKTTGPRGLGARRQVEDQGSRPGFKTRVGDTGPRTKCGERRNKDRGPRLHARLCWGSAGMAGIEPRTGRRVCIILNSPTLRPLPGRCVPWARPPGPVPPGSVPLGPSSWARPPWARSLRAQALGPSAGLVPAPIPAPISADQAKTCKAWIVPSPGR